MTSDQEFQRIMNKMLPSACLKSEYRIIEKRLSLCCQKKWTLRKCCTREREDVRRICSSLQWSKIWNPVHCEW